MKSKLINKERNEYQFELTQREAIHRIYECLKPTNKCLRESDIYRNPNTKEYLAHYVDEWGFKVNICVDIGNLKRYFGSRLIHLKDDGGIFVSRVIPLPK